jgi:two-component system, LytTR family, response regulator
MTILIIEDEPLVALSLAKVVAELEPGFAILGPLTSVKDSKEWLRNHPQPDLILSDIQLSDGIALDIFSDGQTGCPIIFTTAYNEYAIRAFKLNSVDYLLKPVDKDELKAALRKFHLLQSKFSNEIYLRQITDLFLHFNPAQKFKERFAVHIGRSVSFVPVEDILCFIKEDLIYLVNREGKKFISDFRSLDETEELVSPLIFYRANRQCLVQLDFIESYRVDDTGKLDLKIKGGRMEGIIVSKEKAAAFKEWFDR